MKSFSYVDLVLQDTPLNDPNVELTLRGFVQQVDNLTGREDEKLPRMEVRFARVRAFLDYIAHEEQNERAAFSLQATSDVWGVPFMPSIREQVEREIEWISRRLRENRELFPEEVIVWEDNRELVGLGETTEDEDEAAIAD